MLSAAQLRLAIGDDAWNAIPDAHPAAPRLPRQRRPRLEARHRLALSGYVPAIIGCGFTEGQTAVLAILAIEHKKHGYCDLTQTKIGRDANAGRDLVQRTIYQAERWGHIKVERSKSARDRNRPNRITIVNKTWLAWLRLGPSRPRPWGGGHQDAHAKRQHADATHQIVGTILSAQRLSLQKDLRKKVSFDEGWGGAMRGNARRSRR